MAARLLTHERKPKQSDYDYQKQRRQKRNPPRNRFRLGNGCFNFSRFNLTLNFITGNGKKNSLRYLNLVFLAVNFGNGKCIADFKLRHPFFVNCIDKLRKGFNARVGLTQRKHHQQNDDDRQNYI